MTMLPGTSNVPGCYAPRVVPKREGYTYLASPYSHEDPEVRERRATQVEDVVCQMLYDGQLVYSPIASQHRIVKRIGMPGTWDFWSRYDRVMIASAVRFLVLKLDGWETSVGVQAEIEIAKEFELEVEYMEVPSKDN